MRLRLSWYTYGPGVLSGAQALAPLVRDLRARATDPIIETAPAAATNIRRESDPYTGVPAYGLTADVTTTLPAAGGTPPFPAPEKPDGSPFEGAALDRVLNDLRQRIAQITRVTSVVVVVDVPRAISEAERLTLTRRATALVGNYLANNGFLIGARGVSVRVLPASTGSGAVFGLLGLLGLGYFISR